MPTNEVLVLLLISPTLGRTQKGIDKSQGWMLKRSHNVSNIEDEKEHELAILPNTSIKWVGYWLDTAVCKTKPETMLSLGE